MSEVKKVLLFGAGVGSREILRIIRDINAQSPKWEVLGFVEADTGLIGTRLDDLPIIGFNDLKVEDGTYATCAIYDPIIRKKVVEQEIESLGLRLATVIHPSVLLPQDAKLSDGVMIYPGTQVSFNVELGRGTLVFFNTLLGHDLKTGDYCTVCPAATLNGSITLGTGAFVGAAATVHQGVSIGEWTTIGIGTTVLKNVAENKNVMSMPRQIVTDKR